MIEAVCVLRGKFWWRLVAWDAAVCAILPNQRAKTL